MSNTRGNTNRQGLRSFICGLFPRMVYGIFGKSDKMFEYVICRSRICTYMCFPFWLRPTQWGNFKSKCQQRWAVHLNEPDNKGHGIIDENHEWGIIFAINDEVLYLLLIPWVTEKKGDFWTRVLDPDKTILLSLSPMFTFGVQNSNVNNWLMEWTSENTATTKDR